MKKTFLKSILILAALGLALGATVSGMAQAAQETPESVAKAYFAAKQASDWAKCAGLMSPDALADLKNAFAEVVKADKSGEASATIFKLKSSAEFSQLSDAAVFERLMDFVTSSSPDAKTILASSTNTVLGRVDEGPNLAHVVFRSRSKIGDDEINEVDLISLKKQGSTWRALLTSDMEAMINQFLESVAPPEGEPPQPGAGKPSRRP
jgi:hypothetical protein